MLRRYIDRNRRRCYELNQKYYPQGFRRPLDIWIELIEASPDASRRLLNAGCGKGREKIRYAEICSHTVGVDLDMPSLVENKALDHVMMANLEALPFPDKSFDIVICRDVLEHLEDPHRVFREFARVMRPGGRAIFLTPNALNYVSLVSRMTPYALHVAFNQMRGIIGGDTFPTHYRANTRGALSEIARQAGLQESKFHLVQKWPSYLTFSVMLYRVGVLFERTLSRFDSLAFLRSAIVAEYRKAG
jgi:ubiquinone/menaquinone biosynthesis C-methylase UbiE